MVDVGLTHFSFNLMGLLHIIARAGNPLFLFKSAWLKSVSGQIREINSISALYEIVFMYVPEDCGPYSVFPTCE